MICASCTAVTAAAPCGECGGDPLLFGRYRYEARLGSGAFGVTWRAIGPDGAVAVKDVAIPLSAGSKEIELLHREVDVLRQLDHPAIPRLLDHGIEGSGRDRRLVVVLSYLDGETLADESVHHRYVESDVRLVVAKLCDILEYLHDLVPPVIHRDIKPGNVIRRRDGRLGLVDFGSVRDFVPGTLANGTVTGTFGYMAPEQFRGEATAATDFYAVGALAWWMLARVEPRSRMTAGGFAWRDKLAASPEMLDLLTALLEPSPSRRLGSAAAVRDRLATLPEASPGTTVGLEARLATIAKPVPPSLTSLTRSEPIVRFLGIVEPVGLLHRASASGLDLAVRRRVSRYAIGVMSRNGLRLHAIALYMQRVGVDLDAATRAVAEITDTGTPVLVDLRELARVGRESGRPAAVKWYIALTDAPLPLAEDLVESVDRGLELARPETEEVVRSLVSAVFPDRWLDRIAGLLPWSKGRP
jgi:hypothetical protein